MRTTITLEKGVLDELLKVTGAKTKASAVKEAVDDYLRLKKVRKIQSMRGKLSFDLTAEEIRHRER